MGSSKKLRDSRVLLLGCGGTGSITGINIARMGVGNIVAVDFDAIELSNINRQEYNYSDVGKKKASTLVNHIENINPFINVSSKDKKIMNTDDILELGIDYDLVICCIDKPENISELLKSYTRKTHIPWIVGGYASTVITQGIFNDQDDSFSDLLEKDHEKRYISRKIATTKDWFFDNAIVAPVATIAGGFSALYTLYYLTGLKALKFNEVQHVDLYNVQTLKDFSYIISKDSY